MGRISKIVLLILAIGLFPAQAFSLDINENWKMSVTNEIEATYNEVYGPGDDNSFLYVGKSGFTYEDRLNILNRLTLGEIRYEGGAEIRFTNNERIDVEDVSPKKLYIKRVAEDNILQVGDLFANFSQYSLNQNLKGGALAVRETLDNPWNLQVVGGMNKSRWEYVWNDESDELKNQHFYGTRVGRKIGPFEVNLNYVFTDENRLNDISSNTSRSTTQLVKNHLWSTDWRFRPASSFELSGESAVSRRHTTTTAPDLGYAHKLLGRFRFGHLRTQLEYERTPSDFHTPGGSASSDRARYRIRNNYYIDQRELFLNYNTYWDNTQDASSYSTKVKIPEVGFTCGNLFMRKTLSSTISIRQRRRHRSDDSLDERTDNLNFSISDRFGVFRPNLEYEWRKVNPRKNLDDSGERTHSVNLRLNSYHRSDIWTLRPNISIRYEETKDWGTGDSRGINQDWIWTWGLGGNFKSDLRFNLGYNLSRADNYTYDADSRRRAFRGSIDYNIRGNRDNTIRLSYQDRRNSYNDNDNDYMENICKLRWTRRF